jgi:hypothetical protein
MRNSNPLGRIARKTEERAARQSSDPLKLGAEEKESVKVGGDDGAGNYVNYGLFDLTPWDSFIFGDP